MVRAPRVSESETDKPRAAVPRAGAAFSAHFDRGVRYLEGGRYSEALEELQRAAELDPSDPRPHHGIGKVHRKLLFLEQAESAFRRAIALDAAYVPSKKSLAMILHETGKFQEAIGVLKELEAANPDDTFVWAELAINELGLGNAERAIELLERYNAVEGRQAWGHAHLGRAFAAAGETEKAEQVFREALEIDPRFSIAYYHLGQLLAEIGRADEGERLLSTYQQLRELQNRAHQFEMALLKNAADVGALVGLARTRYLLGDAAGALTLIGRARQLTPDDDKLREIEEQVRAAVGSGRPGGLDPSR